ncbi:hypothetical protein PHSC3_000872 [Chlamydiales bacterium STE3]|nr:hypothetical protein PHSC3_000872 [Chlamydiales bacterium STE3]
MTFFSNCLELVKSIVPLNRNQDEAKVKNKQEKVKLRDFQDRLIYESMLEILNSLNSISFRSFEFCYAIQGYYNGHDVWALKLHRNHSPTFVSPTINISDDSWPAFAASLDRPETRTHVGSNFYTTTITRHVCDIKLVGLNAFPGEGKCWLAGDTFRTNSHDLNRDTWQWIVNQSFASMSSTIKSLAKATLQGFEDYDKIYDKSTNYLSRRRSLTGEELQLQVRLKVIVAEILMKNKDLKTHFERLKMVENTDNETFKSSPLLDLATRIAIVQSISKGEEIPEGGMDFSSYWGICGKIKNIPVISKLIEESKDYIVGDSYDEFMANKQLKK